MTPWTLLLPEAAMTSTSSEAAYCIAVSTPASQHGPPRLMLTTRAPEFAAKGIPAATFAYVPLPPELSTLIGMIAQFGATPAIAEALFERAPTMPAQHVPCPWSSCGLLLPPT